jgi:hypothetical protein
LYLNSRWRANIAITGCDEVPPTKIAGNVLRPKTTLRFSMRLPPNYDVNQAPSLVEEIL